MKIIPPVSPRRVVQRSEQRIALLFIKAPGLKIECVEMRKIRALPPGFVLAARSANGQFAVGTAELAGVFNVTQRTIQRWMEQSENLKIEKFGKASFAVPKERKKGEGLFLSIRV